MYGNPLNTRANITGADILGGLGALNGLGSTVYGFFDSSNKVQIANAQLEATKAQQEALIKQYELQYQTKLTDAQKQGLLNEQAKQLAEAGQKKTETYILGAIGAMVVAGILYAILKK